jgi:hypothetical protein
MYLFRVFELYKQENPTAMKYFILSVFIFLSVEIFAAPGIHEAIKSPSTVTILKFTGEKDEAALFLKNASRFTALKHIQLCGISDSIIAEQDIASIAACPSVTKVSFEQCGFSHLSGAVKMLVAVKEVEISDCNKLEIDGTFSTLAGMPSLKSISYSTDKLTRLPKSFIRMRGLEKISFHNTDLSLADGYALNTSGRESLLANEKLQLGFGTSVLVLEYSCYDKASAKEHISLMRDMLQGVPLVNGEMVFPKKPIAFTRENPLVRPPVAGLDVQKNIYSTNAVSGGMVEYPSGTKIFIPEHAFVDANGNEVKGEVTIDYREFRDPIDILVSGIPMVYDSGGVKGNFESAGMFELNASVNGQEVFLAPGKKVDMNFAVVDTASSYNFYRLDSKNGWEYLGKPGAVVNTDAVKINDQQAVEEYNRIINYRRVDRFRTQFDSVPLAERYEDTGYVFTTKKAALFLGRKVNARKVSNITFKKTFNGKDFTVFHISFKDRNLPEMNSFSTTDWMINGKMSAMTMRRKYGPKRGLHDMRIEYNGGNDFTIEVKDLNGFERIAVTPVRIIHNKPVAYAERECKWRYRSYDRQLKGRERGMARQIKRERKRYFKVFPQHKVDSFAAWNSVRAVMTSSEQKLSFVQWKEFVAGKLESLKNEVNAETASSSAMLRSLSLDGFGIYNCDQIQRLESPVEIFAACLNGSGADTKASTIYIIDNHTNGVLTYGAGFGEGMKTKLSPGVSIAFSPQYQTSMIAIGANGEMYIAGPDQFKEKSFVSGRKYNFNVVAAGKDQTIGDLRATLFPKEGK